ncbi:MAG: multicopper oxidase domain-containing protein [Nitrospirales bacterium]|nr:multicopper oxidase domain-containing protein [Nitrospirales bacterium]
MLWCNKLFQATTLLTASTGLALVMGGVGFGEERHPTESNTHSGHRVASSSEKFNNWVEKLKGQTVVEDSIEGRPDRAAKVDRQHERLMAKMGHQMQADMQRAGTDGSYHTTSMLHQYGAGGQDYLLASDREVEPVSSQVGRCPANAPEKHFDISAINVEITLNQWLDYYPGYMYVLTKNIEKVREEEARNAKAREQEGFDQGSVSNGLQTGWIQPLVVRANQGDCMRVTLRNQLDFGESVSFHIHGSSMVVSHTGQPATTTNPDSVVEEGQTIDLEWYIHPETQEGGRQFHSYSNDRELTVMGMFGAMIVEPKGSTYLTAVKSNGPAELESGWQAIIQTPATPDFREFVVIYHEVGDEAFRPVNKQGDFLPQRDPMTDVYRPGARALNYRSEPFGINYMHLQHEYFGFEDESLGYSSYTFGDAPTPIPRSYLGDPAKYRLIHGGSEIFHSHHPHGGSIRWARSPRATDEMPLWHKAKNGPVKYPVIRTKSDRVDTEVIGPSEALDLETECGSGLCQQGAGDFLYHCHVAHHYVAGMWGYWRVYNTLQAEAAHTDVMPELQELPDRMGRMKHGVPSDQLVGKTLDWFGKKFQIIEKGQSDWKASPAVVTIKDWVSMQLPTPGQPGHTDDERGQIMAYDASVWDWTWDGNTALGEHESTIVNPKYTSPTPGQRRALLFDPMTGKLAWPHMTPHFGKRVPFAPDHNPAPWLEPIRRDANGNPSTQPAKPGENGRWSLCPDNARRAYYNVHFIETPIELTAKEGTEEAVVDPKGLIFVAHEEEEAIRANNDLKLPLVFRANIYDCLDYVLTSEWEDDDITNFQSSKINTHFHFVQFDTQSSDGVITGMSYEQSVRPFTMLEKKLKKGLPVPMNAVLLEPAKQGEQSIKVSNAKQYHQDTLLLVGADNVEGNEIRRIKTIEGQTITFHQALEHDHPANDIVTVEFVRQRFWLDADVGTVFCHDHAFGATTWPHGGFCSLLVEPVGSTYHDPVTGKPIRTGPIADIHSTEPVGYGVNNSFRELAVQMHDTVPHTVNIVTEGNPPGQPIEVALEAGKTVSFQMPESLYMTPMPFLNGGTHTTGSGIDYRAEPIALRLKVNPDPSQIFSSLVHGDPSTPLLRAYTGDTLVFRLVESLMNETHVFTVAGHTFLTERYAGDANRKNSIHVGIAERYDLVVPEAGGPRRQAGDYMYFNGRSSKLSEGSWGIIRIFDKPVPDLQPLPAGFSGKDDPQEGLPVCPPDAPVKAFKVHAIDFPDMHFNSQAPEAIEVDFERKIQLKNSEAKIYVLEEEVTKVGGEFNPMPLTLRANVGDCIAVHLTNNMKEGRTSFSAFSLAFDPKDSLGMNLGMNPGDQTIGPGENRTYTYYADPSNGEITSLVWDGGDLMNNPRNGLFGSVIIGPKGSVYRDPKTGEDITLKNSWVADVLVDTSIPGNEHRKNYRDVALFFQDEDNIIGTSFMPYVQNVAGLTGVNYRSEPYPYREEAGCSVSRMFQPCTVEEPRDPSTPLIQAHAGDPVRIHVLGASSEQNGMFSVEKHEWPIEPFMPGADLLSVVEFGGSEVIDAFIPAAGGDYHLPGDYVWNNQRLPYSQSGQWGYMRVLPVGDQRLLPLSGTSPGVKEARTHQSGGGQVTPVGLK